jgi:anti-sigma B factor antagonist
MWRGSSHCSKMCRLTMASPTFDIGVEDDGTSLVLRLFGELDLATVPLVDDAVRRHGREREGLVVDLRGLDFMDSSGLRLMIELQRLDGVEVAFVAPGERVARLFDITGVRSMLRWVAEPAADETAG